ncbi:protein of unknown function [Marivirga sericea]|uniref:DUF4249 domain-containing protein n=1 Tax=Marivirga sericea TaxID=1028 RepID=A0A1X7KDS0_9BACT|nr:DUF4249 domain-containing protein [Marivirga sericea]SMG38595.1 protein of unknown function [Marivirga sericea]
MSTNNPIAVFLIVSLFVISCIDPFDVKVPSSEIDGSLVVDAVLQRESAVHEIILSRPASINQNSGYIRVSDAKVEILDSQNNCFVFNETSKGRYSVDSAIFKPQFGMSYSLVIKLPNGEIYESEEENFVEVDPIDSVWVKPEKFSFVAGSNVIEGDIVNVYTNIFTTEKTIYDQYEYEGTFGFESVYQGSEACDEFGPIGHSPREDLVCFRTETVDLPLNIISAENLKKDQNVAQNILSIFPDRRFFIGYSLLIKKKRLSENYFQYLDEIKTQNEVQGSLFDPPPSPIVGNIRNVQNRDIEALGFFALLSETTKRIFISKEILRAEINRFDFTNCSDNFDEFNSLNPEAIVLEQNVRRPDPTCCDCRLVPGATDQIPEFFPPLD